ncbi:DUF4303 domain-containing protein [Spiractinospora alimapuensis]|uniref:DUF4303 domain-containing protein n=1 Tax=Spiractinospora alimapuensis TaxID=2820884 RepID=UPI001F280494|nr:DUF4303 domain-containing protein [Spiractinospora alimapuensis]QVQ53858.1 DUF4303 domain-containing protein [Spiractinospora alimapuensis]
MSDELLVQRLVSAARAAFTHARDADPDELFYCHAFYASSGLFTSIQPVCTTERDHRATIAGTEHSAEQEEFLRWNPPDWPGFDAAEESAAEEMTALQDTLSDRLPDPFAEGLDAAVAEAEAATRYEACVQALEILDAEGCFGAGEERERTILAVLCPEVAGDEEADAVRHLNPRGAIDRYFPDGVWEGPPPLGDPLALDCPPTPHIAALAHGRDGDALLACGPGGDLFSWDLNSGNPPRVAREERRHLWRAAMSSDGSVAVVGCSLAETPRAARTYRVDLTSLALSDLCAGGDAALAVSPDGRLVATSDYEGTLRCVDVASGSDVWTETRPVENIAFDLQFSPDSATLTVGGRDTTLVDAATGKTRAPLLTTEGVTRSTSAWSPDGSRVAVGDARSGTIAIHTIADPSGPPIVLPSPPPDGGHAAGDDGVNALGFSPDGTRLASAHDSGDLHLWSVAGEHLLRLRAWQDSLNAVVFLHPDEVIAAGDDTENSTPIAVWTLGSDDSGDGFEHSGSDAGDPPDTAEAPERAGGSS